jgi:hypothetical protein
MRKTCASDRPNRCDLGEPSVAFISAINICRATVRPDRRVSTPVTQHAADFENDETHYASIL